METIRVGGLEIVPSEGLARAGPHVLTLSVREFQLLVALAERAGSIVSREQLSRSVWERELRDGDRSVDVYVSKLRAKLEVLLPDERYIHTHAGFGYRFQPEPSQAVDNRDVGPDQTAPQGAHAGAVSRQRATP